MLWFSWDGRKAQANLAKHGVSFEEAETAFADPLGWIYPDPLHSADERREVLIAESSRGRVLLVCFREAPGGSVRIISSREPTKNERRKYEAGRADR